jgi:antitoxin MazE
VSTVIKTHIVKIGNSQGVRIPKVLLEQTGLVKDVEMRVEEGKVVISAIQEPRHGWEEQFRLMAERGDDRLLDEDAVSLSEWDTEEWEW